MEATATKLPPNVTVYEGRQIFTGELPERVKKGIEAKEVKSGKKPAKLLAILAKATEKLKAEKAARVAKEKPETESLPTPLKSPGSPPPPPVTGANTGK